MDAMITLLNEYDDTKIDSRYRLVLIAAQRARQLMQGSKPLITSKLTKETLVALDEVLQGQTEFITGPEAKTALNAARVARAMAARIRPALPGPRSEGETEIEKDLNKFVKERNDGEG